MQDSETLDLTNTVILQVCPPVSPEELETIRVLEQYDREHCEERGDASERN